MFRKKKILQIVAVIGVAAFYAITQRFGDGNGNNSTRQTAGESTIQWDSANSSDANQRLLNAIASQRSDVQVVGSGEVVKVLPDDTKGSQHQRFLVKVSPQNVILIAHNIDLAPRVDALREGDTIRFNGEFEWNDKGGVVHWTHKDPRGKHVHGWLEHDGEKYW
ncbi:MAG: DUF3465 domain-containing protein [Acidiferrobacterales bacterium]|nr:DUF3465 domain-containing protein [Acidiferrobacterales bacterium]